MAAYTNSLPVDSYDGVVKGIFNGTSKDVAMEWADNAKDRMAQTAARYKAPQATLKAATEHLAYDCVARHQKDRARIMYGTVSSINRINMLNFFPGDHFTTQPPTR